MKAVTYSRYGSADVLSVTEVDPPSPKDDEVLIRVRATEVTKADVELRSFKFAVQWFWLPLRIAFGITKPRRQILGGYFSGEVMATGKDVTEFVPGEEVYGAAGLRFGAYGEYVALPAGYAITRKPTNMSFAEAAAVPLGGFNGLHFMRKANIKSGDQVLINGAGGSIGLHALQIAKSMGAHVTAVDHGRKQETVTRFGADRFIDYTQQGLTTLEPHYDVVFDMVAGSSYRQCMRLLKPGGRYLSGNPRLSLMVRSIFTNRFTDKSVSFAFADESKLLLESLTDLIEAGTIQPIVDRVYPMREVRVAHRRVESEERLGAIVLSISESPSTS